MADNIFIKMSREALYNEIWEISAAGTARKYDIPYAELLKLCKEVQIPIPPSGYWTKLSFGKPVEKVNMPEHPESEVILPVINNETRLLGSLVNLQNNDSKNEKNDKLEEKSNMETQITIEMKDDEEGLINYIDRKDDENNLEYPGLSDKLNVYKREKLYEEVWEKPVVQVALSYGVSDVMIHKICKSLDIPVPPRGYWSRLRAGEKINKPPLPVKEGVNQILGQKTYTEVKVIQEKTLNFLSEHERQKVLLAAEQIQLSLKV